MIRRPPRSTRTDTLFPYTTLFRSDVLLEPGTGQFTRGNAAARLVFAFDDQRLYARFGEIAADDQRIVASARDHDFVGIRSEEHTSELQSLMRISYAVFCLKKKIKR